MRLDAKGDASTGAVKPFLCTELSWDGGTTWTAAKSTGDLATSESTFILGNLNDTWGRTWSVGDFSNANSRVRITDVGNHTTTTFSLDNVAVQVTYTTP